MGLFDKELLYNAAVAAPAGLVAGGIGAILLRKLEANQMAEEGFPSPERRATLPMMSERKPIASKPPKRAKKEKEAAISMGHVAGGVLGAAGGMHVTNKLLARQQAKLLDLDIERKDRELNHLLTREQSLASGLNPASFALASKAANCKQLDAALVKLASQLYDILEKQADVSIKSMLADALQFLALGQKPFGQALIAGSGIGGTLYGYHLGAKTDPARVMADAVKDSLKERLTGKDQLVGPMPIRVETERPMLRPIHPGSSSLVDPTKGRDILAGI